MASLNKVMLIGNLTQDPEVRRTTSGTAVSTLRMAVNESFQNKNGEKVERTVFLDVDVWDRQAETCQQYLSKGSPIFVEGRLQMDSWDDKETGQKRSRLKVRAERLSGDANNILYQFSLSHGADCLLEGRAAVILDAAAPQGDFHRAAVNPENCPK